MPGDSRLKESTQRTFRRKTRRAWNKRKTSPASAPLRSAPLPNALDLLGASASLPVDNAAASSSGTDGSSFAGTTRVDSTYYPTAEQAQRTERSEQCKHVLSGKSTTQRKFDLLEVNGSGQTSDAGAQFVIVDMEVLNDLFTSKNANASLDSVKRAAAEAVAIHNQGRRVTNESIAAGLGYATGYDNASTIKWDCFRKLLCQTLAALAAQNPATQLSHFIVSATEEAGIVKVKQDCPTPDTHLPPLWNRRTKRLKEYRTAKPQEDLQEVNNPGSN
ncbi:hypothetical protein HPB47_016645 [Ixodes persulcatus]|uniref:Uncharacterized protein n=1 Tax=Ixodes persulcatus TaxID=34615 RepID=A0AC60QQJ6_IXOPE|nr:hypothetical protein HPB47_016645 [Ixodes persulcatus]